MRINHVVENDNFKGVMRKEEEREEKKYSYLRSPWITRRDKHFVIHQMQTLREFD